ncbi:glycosyltransferase [Oceanicaulis alexandrii]|uniref:glycosyltransferase n=1 Tax=Oceanicaulis alexandrii TaxID=153233 RepID=UPI002354260D|nr:glycosyltransferase [Oceanicaulis alexandrii]
MMSALPSRNWIWLKSPPWAGVWTRQNHFSRRFAAEGCQILYVENPVSLRTRLDSRDVSGLLAPSVREVEPGIHVMRLGQPLPGDTRSETIASANAARQAASIRAWVRRAGWRGYAAWCRVPGSLPVLERLSPAFTVYDVTDDYPLYARSAREKALTIEREAKLAKRADQIFLANCELADKPAFADRPVAAIPNGVDDRLFARAGETAQGHAVLEGLKRPVIGYLGLTADWMDFDLLEKLGARWPGQVVMVGPVKAEVAARARRIEGIEWRGFVPHQGVPDVIAGFDVCTLPHLTSELRHRADPLKVVEYLALGKPVVSVDLRCLRPFSDLISIAHDHQAFLDLVEVRLENPQPELDEARKAAARARSWDRLFRTLVDTIAAHQTGPA